MSKLFVTVLGVNKYSDCIYYQGDKSFRTPFIQEALINLLYQVKDEDKILDIDYKYKLQDFDMKILLTEKALKINYYGENKLKSILEKYNITPELVIIPEGKTSDELWDIFDKVSKTIDETANKLNSDKNTLDVNIDITHSLRNIPMQIVVAMNYLTLFNNINLEGIYYGAFELGEFHIDDNLFTCNKSTLDLLYDNPNTDNNLLNKLKSITCSKDLDIDSKNEILRKCMDYRGCTIKHAPICNLYTYYDLLKWTNAINSFIKCGNTEEINELTRLKKDQAFKSDDKAYIEDMKLVSYVVESLDKFTNCINTCRGMYDTKKAKNPQNSIKSAYNILSKDLHTLDKNITIMKPLKNLFKLVENKIKPFESENVLDIGIATINWCIDYNLYQQAYTALDETLKALLCIKLRLSENSYTNREDISNAILAGAYYTNAFDVVVQEDLSDHYKNIIYNSIDILIKEKDFYNFVKKVKAYRNDLNHFGFNKSVAIKYSDLSKKLNSLRDDLIKYSKSDSLWNQIKDLNQ